ncbi:hypothetical protein FRB94_007376 [Tulasnella sp. JGI-2019a]|nr:hypothetical protein FRB93_007114 [Tulasnella sp. JGI-2019a]KAG8997906.1 hypothetical protein FRB94_007376 [Tulasnella sp. JGI-2019a]KAG9029110.1 hypothetical protein FRB95_005653 [Tulasnella sp. JGI-2019a]
MSDKRCDPTAHELQRVAPYIVLSTFARGAALHKAFWCSKVANACWNAATFVVHPQVRGRLVGTSPCCRMEPGGERCLYAHVIKLAKGPPCPARVEGVAGSTITGEKTKAAAQQALDVRLIRTLFGGEELFPETLPL